MAFNVAFMLNAMVHWLICCSKKVQKFHHPMAERENVPLNISIIEFKCVKTNLSKSALTFWTSSLGDSCHDETGNLLGFFAVKRKIALAKNWSAK